VILFADQVGVRPDHLSGATWGRVGQRPTVARTGKRFCLNAMSAISPRGDHQLLGTTWLPLGTTAHEQGRIAGENATGGHARFASSLGTQVVKVFDLFAAVLNVIIENP
jgi:hypothetical protein